MDIGPSSGPLKGSTENLVPSKCGSTQKMAAHVKVVVRVRPLNERESDHNRIVEVIDGNFLIFDPKEKVSPFFYQGVQLPNKSYHKRSNKELKFVFDHVCGQEATNKDVFETATKDMMSSLMEGYNCSVFVYGATGAGKTFTMIGNKEHPGITYLTMEHLFDTINSLEDAREFDIGVSYIEVYNENVYDLIKPSKSLQLREDNKYGVMVAGLSLHKIHTAKQLLDMLENGNKNRKQHPTDANAESSRSHAVFQVYIKMSYKTSSQIRMVKLSMIDLAGSERAAATGCLGERFKEGANINRSLLSLANCINKLAEGSNYIPYRDSKLTRLLKDSLGGNCKTVMIANVSPASNSYEDTYNTLKYATRANNINLSIKKNIMDVKETPALLAKINQELKKRILELEARLLTSNCCTGNCGELGRKRKIEESEKEMVQYKREAINVEKKLTLANGRQNLDREKVVEEWRRRILEAEAAHSVVQSALLGLLTRQSVLARRHATRTHGFAHLVELAHRSSSDAIEQICSEEIPRQERAADNYAKEEVRLGAKIMSVQKQWDASRKKLDEITKQALSQCPELKNLVEAVHFRCENRKLEAKNDLANKLLLIEQSENEAFSIYTREMPQLLKEFYMMLKGYEKLTPDLTAKYAEIMKNAKSLYSNFGISWWDENSISDLHLNNIPDRALTNPIKVNSANTAENETIDMTDSDYLTDIENRDPVTLSARKRKGTLNNETIIINDSLEALDVTKPSAKKIKTDCGASYEVENFASDLVQSTDLNSTFDMAGKMDALKKHFKANLKEAETPVYQPIKRELTDRTNIMYRSVNFNGPSIVKPVLAKVVPTRRPAPPSRPAQPPTHARRLPAPGFGSSLSRDGTPLTRNVQGECPRGGGMRGAAGARGNGCKQMSHAPRHPRRYRSGTNKPTLDTTVELSTHRQSIQHDNAG